MGPEMLISVASYEIEINDLGTVTPSFTFFFISQRQENDFWLLQPSELVSWSNSPLQHYFQRGQSLVLLPQHARWEILQTGLKRLCSRALSLCSRAAEHCRFKLGKITGDENSSEDVACCRHCDHFIRLLRDAYVPF